jgi:hypothetical protein
LTFLKSNRHDRGWPRITLSVEQIVSDQSYRLMVTAQGRVDGKDARGNWWEIIQWVRSSSKRSGTERTSEA